MAQIRWNCEHCKADGWSSGGVVPPHDRLDGGSCRPSGQLDEDHIRDRMDLEQALETLKLLAPLATVVQYRDKGLKLPSVGPHVWETIAAFNVSSVAKDYCNRCSVKSSTHEYRTVELS